MDGAGELTVITGQNGYLKGRQWGPQWNIWYNTQRHPREGTARQRQAHV